jgi:hypothetical protein
MLSDGDGCIPRWYGPVGVGQAGPMAQLPGPLRAALGVIATVVDDPRKLPERALELPVLAVSTALQMSLRAQQRYAALTVKGDEFLGQLRGLPDEPPEWARFDDDEAFQPAGEALAPTVLADEVGEGLAEPPDAPPAEDEVATRRKNTVKKPRKGKPSAFDSVADVPTDDESGLPEMEGFSIPPRPSTSDDE